MTKFVISVPQDQDPDAVTYAESGLERIRAFLQAVREEEPVVLFASREDHDAGLQYVPRYYELPPKLPLFSQKREP